MSIVKSIINEKVDDYSVFELEDDKQVKIYLGAIRQEYNNRYFKSRKYIGDINVTKILLHDDDIKNIKLNVDRDIETSKYSKVTLKNNAKLNIIPIIDRTVTIRKETVILNNGNKIYNFKLKNRNISDGVYNNAIITYNGETPVLVIKTSSKLKRPISKKKKMNKINASIRKSFDFESEKLRSVLKIKKSDKVKERERKKKQSNLFKILYEFFRNYDINLYSITKAFEMGLIKKHENQVFFGVLPFDLPIEVREMMLNDFYYLNLSNKYMSVIEDMLSLEPLQ